MRCKLAAITAFCGIANWFIWLHYSRSCATGPFVIDVNIDPQLNAEGAVHPGPNLTDASGAHLLIDVTVDSSLNRELHLTAHAHSFTLLNARDFDWQSSVDIWISFDGDRNPSARVDFRAGSLSPPTLIPVRGVTGSITLNHAPQVQAQSDARSVPLVVAYTLEGDYGGSPASTDGKIAIP